MGGLNPSGQSDRKKGVFFMPLPFLGRESTESPKSDYSKVIYERPLITQGSRVIVNETISDIGGLAGGRVTSIIIMSECEPNSS